MRITSVKAIIIGCIFALFALALAPAMALASTQEMGTHCDSSATPSEAPLTNSCLIHCQQIIQCRVSSAVESRTVNYNSPGNADLVACPNSPDSAGEVQVTATTPPPLPEPGIQPLSSITYQCRNSLNSEDPASL